MSDQKICPTCSTEYPKSERFCPRDGSALRGTNPLGDLVGSVIAERYHVLRKLGEGGMGTVYLAEHVKMGRKAALKVMNPGTTQNADAIARFNREAANASRLSHPNICGIYDFGENSDGLIYLAMEFIDGESLSSLIERLGRLPPARTASIIRQCAEALQVAHDAGLVHRDLKPDNIMVTKSRDGSDVAKVVDFGIAKGSSGELRSVTKTGLVIGTPDYMSPEQSVGDRLDGRSDIYALGLVAFNALTGKLPFANESTQEAMVMRLTERPRTLADVVPEVSWPADLEMVIAKALVRDVKDRYQHASDFGRDIFAAVEHLPETIATGARTAQVPKAGMPPANDMSGIRVLAIDDHAVIRRTLRVVLGGLGITDIEEAGTVDAAEQLLRDAAPFDVVFCDLNLPGRTGIDLLRAMPGLSGRTAVILLSGEDERILRSVAAMGRASGLHVLAAMSKPPTAAKIKVALSRLNETLPGRLSTPQDVVVTGEDVGLMLREGTIGLHFLPKVELASGAVVGVEALLRARHPVHGLLPPLAVLNAAQENDFVGALTFRVMSEAIAAAARLRADGLDISMSLHLDTAALGQVELPDTIQRLATEHQVPMGSLTLEIAEQAVFDNYVRAIDVTTRLRLKRCQLSIGNFGAGRSGLRQLQELPFSELKIDRAFVAGCDSVNPDGRNIIEATIGLAKALGIKTVAKCVETAAEYDTVRSLGAHFVQGYYVSKPLAENQVVDWMGEWAARMA